MNDVRALNAHESEHHLGKCDVCGCDGFNDLKLMRTHHSVAHRGYQVWSLKKTRIFFKLDVFTSDEGDLAFKPSTGTPDGVFGYLQLQTLEVSGGHSPASHWK